VSSSDEIFWAVRRLLETLAAERPLIVCIEDIHWAEPTLLDLLEYLAGFIQHAPVLLICLARPELAERRPLWMTRDVVVLEPLSEQDSETLLDGLGDLDPETRRRIRAAAEGNPLFAEQLAALALDGGETVLPPTIQALLAARLDMLEPVERAVIEYASVVGREFSRGDVVALAPAELHDAVGTTLLSLIRKGLIRPDEGAGPRDGFRFHHILIRDAAYDGMPKAARAALHERLADQLEHAERRSELEEIVGYHLEQAYILQGDLGVADVELGVRAGERLELVGRKALMRSDLHAAIDLLERAASLSADDGARRAKLLPEIGAAMIEAGRLSEAERVLGEAIAVAAETGDKCAESRAFVQQQFLKLLNVTEGGAAEAARVLQQVVPIFERGKDVHGLCDANRLEAFLHWNDARAAAAAEAWERAAGHASRAGDERAHAEILTWIASALVFGPTPVVEGISRCEEILSDIKGHLESEALTRRHLGVLYAMNGRFELARSLVATSNAVFEDLGLTLNAATSPNEAAIEMLAGNPAAAEFSLRSGFEALTRIGERSFLSTTTAYLARAVFAQDRLDEAEDLAQLSAQLTASDDVLTQALWRGVQARILARRGRLEEAETLARQAVSIADQTDFLIYRGDALVDLAHILRDGGRAEEARVATAAGLHLHEEKGNLVTSRKIRSDLAGLV
jgi:predicted ATPase